MNIYRETVMNKRLLLYIPTFVVLVLLAALILINQLQPPDWKVRLNQYLAFQHAAGEPALNLVTAIQAKLPAQFTPAMSAESFSDSAIFATSHGTDVQYSAALLPLPYPPQAVWYVLLKGDSQQQVVFVARHNSLYNADWIVHIPPQPFSSPALQTNLSLIGCSFD
jgi:hypothetical protein